MQHGRLSLGGLRRLLGRTNRDYDVNKRVNAYIDCFVDPISISAGQLIGRLTHGPILISFSLRTLINPR